MGVGWPEALQHERHNYIKKLLALASEGKLDLAPGTLSHLHVLHDDDCAVWSGGFCDCDPVLVLEKGGRRQRFDSLTA